MTIESETAAAEASGRDRPVPWAAVVVVLLGLFMATLDSFIVIVAGPAIESDLDASAGDVQWVLAGYQLSFAVALVTAGRVAERIGRRRMFLLGTVVFVAASLLCAIGPTAGALVAARVVQGLGAAMVVPQVFAMIAVLVPEHGRARVFGAVGVVFGLASMGGQLLGGLLVQADLFGWSWRTVFAINLPIGVVVLALALRLVPETRGVGRRPLDLRGVLALAVALLLLMFPLIQGREYGWPPWAYALLAASLVAFAGFVVVERRVERRGGEPLVRLSLFRRRSFSVGLLLVISVYTVIFSYYLALAAAMQQGLGLTAVESGLVYAPAAVMSLVFSVVAGRLVPRFGRWVLGAGAVVVGVGYLGTAVSLRWAGEISPQLVIPSLMVQSVGGGLLITPSLGAVLARIAPADVGVASGILSTAQQVGAALGVAVIGGIFFHTFDAFDAGASPVHAATDAFTTTSLATAGAAGLALLLVLALPATDPPTRGRPR